MLGQKAQHGEPRGKGHPVAQASPETRVAPRRREWNNSRATRPAPYQKPETFNPPRHRRVTHRRSSVLGWLSNPAECLVLRIDASRIHICVSAILILLKNEYGKSGNLRLPRAVTAPTTGTGPTPPTSSSSTSSSLELSLSLSPLWLPPPPPPSSAPVAGLAGEPAAA